MPRKSFLTRIDNSNSINGSASSGHSNKGAYEQLNKIFKVAILTLLDLFGIKPKGMGKGSRVRHSGRRRKRSLF